LPFAAFKKVTEPFLREHTGHMSKLNLTTQSLNVQHMHTEHTKVLTKVDILSLLTQELKIAEH
jgi:hypothetical protein